MTTKTYKSYTVQIVGLSHHIFRPGKYEDGLRDQTINSQIIASHYASCVAMSMAEAKRWINKDIQERQRGVV